MKRSENIKTIWGLAAVIILFVMYYTVCLSEAEIITDGALGIGYIAETLVLCLCLGKAEAFIWQRKDK